MARMRWEISIQAITLFLGFGVGWVVWGHQPPPPKPHTRIIYKTPPADQYTIQCPTAAIKIGNTIVCK